MGYGGSYGQGFGGGGGGFGGLFSMIIFCRCNFFWSILALKYFLIIPSKIKILSKLAELSLGLFSRLPIILIFSCCQTDRASDILQITTQLQNSSVQNYAARFVLILFRLRTFSLYFFLKYNCNITATPRTLEV